MECTGRDIWSIKICREKRVPQQWIDELANCFESGFRHDRQTIYYNESMTNQFEGVFDRDLAIKLAQFLGIDASSVIATALNPEQEVSELKEAAIDM